VDAILHDTPPLIGGEEALRAVLLAQKLIESGQQHKVIAL
jgi:hypothetical protein